MTNFDFTHVVYDSDGAARTTDVLAFVAGPNGWEVLLIVRGIEPFKGQYATPGGFLEKGTDPTPAHGALRELEEETGLAVALPEPGYEEKRPDNLARGRLCWLGYYNAPGRDPRFQTATDCYVVVLDHRPEVAGADDAAHAEFVDFDSLLKRLDAGESVLAFDHDTYLPDAAAMLADYGVSPSS